MKGSHPRITLLGSNSGNNLGDAAILSSILESLTKEIPDAEFYVPSTNPPFINDNYRAKYNVRGVSIMPWTLSLRMLGLPTFWCLLRSDVALICDGIIFGKKLFNPAFNFLITLIFVVPFARLVGCKMVCYSCGIGPFPSFWSKLFARWVINGSDLIMLRENDSRKLAEEIGVTRSIELTGDAAFINPVSTESRAEEICRKLEIPFDRPTLGVNVTKYLDTWLERSERVDDKRSFLNTFAEAISLAQLRVGEKFPVVIFSTHPMDEPYCRELAALTAGTVVNNSEYLSHEIQAVMRRCQLFIGMRFHSLVLASAVEVPIIGLIYAPKCRGYMRLLECPEYSVELSSISAESLAQTLAKAWKGRAALKVQQLQHVNKLKAGAVRASQLIRERYFSHALKETAHAPLSANG